MFYFILRIFIKFIYLCMLNIDLLDMLIHFGKFPLCFISLIHVISFKEIKCKTIMLKWCHYLS